MCIVCGVILEKKPYETFETLRNLTKPYETLRNLTKPYETLRNLTKRLKPYETLRNVAPATCNPAPYRARPSKVAGCATFRKVCERYETFENPANLTKRLQSFAAATCNCFCCCANVCPCNLQLFLLLCKRLLLEERFAQQQK